MGTEDEEIINPDKPGEKKKPGRPPNIMKKEPEIPKKMPKTAMEQRRDLLLSRLSRTISGVIYPEEQIRQFKLELIAIKKGIWKPGWKAPVKRTIAEEIIES